ncbi:MAG: cyclopropane-fatty-acyl-phospholipid synthase family protein [Methylococcales bacterium]
MNAVTASLNKPASRMALFFRKVFLDKLAGLDNAELSIIDSMGTTRLGKPATDNLCATIQVNNLAFYQQVALGGSVGAAEAYMDQYWQADDLCKVIQILVRNRDLLDSLEGGLALLTNQLLKIGHFFNRNSQEGSRKNIAAHYDLGNDLFELFLDAHGMYSSATFYRPDVGLEQASVAKLERICQKLALKPTDHVLEIGTGWGGFATYAAKVYGCKVTTTTISKEQYKAAYKRITAAGVAGKVTVLLEDYRDLKGHFDKLVSIEMIEAVGHHYLDTYLKKCADLLKPDGLAIIQAITIEDRYYKKALNSVDFIKRYIFPGSFIPCVSAIINSSAHSTDLRLINLEDQGESYAHTLNSWRKNFMAALPKVRGLGYNEEFIRMWEFYLCYCEGGFLEKSISNVQLVFAKPDNRREQWLPNL